MASRLSEQAARVHLEIDSTILQRDDIAGLQQHDVARRIVWLTPGGEISPASQAGGRPATGGANGTRKVSTHLREEDVQAHIFGENRAATEAILDQVIAACSNVWGPSVRLQRYTWVSEERPNSGLTLRTNKVVLFLQLRMPVVVESKELGTFDTVTDVCGTLNDDGTVTPQP